MFGFGDDDDDKCPVHDLTARKGPPPATTATTSNKY